MNNSNHARNILGGLGMMAAGILLILLVVIYWLPGEVSKISGLTATQGNPSSFDEVFGFNWSDLWFIVIGIAVALIGGGVAMLQGKTRK